MKRKGFIPFCLGLIGLLTLTSCGETTSNGSNTSSGDASKNVEVVFWHTMGQGLADTLNKKIEEFQTLVKKNEGVNVTVKAIYQSGYDTILLKIANGYSVGNTPTLAVAYPDHVAEYLNYGGEKGDFVVNLDKYINNEKYTFGTDAYYGDNIKGTSDFIQSFYTEGQNYAKSGTYSLPFQKSTELMFYNKNIVEKKLAPKFKKESETVSEFLNTLTWDEFMAMNAEVAADIKGTDHVYGNSLKVPAVYDSDGNLFITQLYQRNIPYLGYENGKGKVLFNNEQAKTFISELKTQYDNGEIWTKGSNGGKYGSDTFKNVETLFSIGSSGGSGYQDSDSFPVGVCPVPAYSRERAKYVTQGITLALFNNLGFSTEKNELATLYGWKFMKYLTSTTCNVDMIFGSQGYVPVRTSAFESPDYQEYLVNEGEDLAPAGAKVVYEVIKDNYINTPVFKGSAVARKQVEGIVTQVLNGSKTVEKAFADAYNEVLISM